MAITCYGPPIQALHAVSLTGERDEQHSGEGEGSLDVELLLEVGGLAAALEHLVQELLGHVGALLPAGLLLQRRAQRVVGRLRARQPPPCSPIGIC